MTEVFLNDREFQVRVQVLSCRRPPELKQWMGGGATAVCSMLSKARPVRPGIARLLMAMLACLRFRALATDAGILSWSCRS